MSITTIKMSHNLNTWVLVKDSLTGVLGIITTLYKRQQNKINYQLFHS